MTRATLAVAADYADAMLIARRWKNLLVLLLLLFLLVQIGVFFAVRFYGTGRVTLEAGSASPPTTTSASASESGSATQPAISRTQDLSAGGAWLTNVADFLAIVCVTVLVAVLGLIVAIMLVGRLIGVSHVTSAFVWSVVLAVLLFPWQSLWNYPIAGSDPAAAAPAERVEVGPHFGLPGVLYTWPELQHRAHFDTVPWTAATVGWARFVGWPIVAILILLSVQARSSRGLKFALGEAEVQVAEVAAATAMGSTIAPPPGTL